jgi:hypothetical protein
MAAAEKPHDHPRCHNGAQALWVRAALIEDASPNPSHVTFAAALDARQRLACQTVELRSMRIWRLLPRRHSGGRPSQTPAKSGGPHSGGKAAAGIARSATAEAGIGGQGRRRQGKGMQLQNLARQILVEPPLALDSDPAARTHRSKVLPPYDFLLAVARGSAITSPRLPAYETSGNHGSKALLRSPMRRRICCAFPPGSANPCGSRRPRRASPTATSPGPALRPQRAPAHCRDGRPASRCYGRFAPAGQRAARGRARESAATGGGARRGPRAGFAADEPAIPKEMRR